MRKLFIPAACLALGACTMGPDYAGAPRVLPAAPEGSSSFVRGDDIAQTQPGLANWWEALGDPVLNRLEQAALDGSPDLAVARARLDQARGALQLDRADGLPSVGAQAAYAHLRIPGLGLGTEEDAGTPPQGGEADAGDNGSQSANIYNLGLTTNWELDLFGGRARTVEAARAELGAAEASAADARLSLTTAVAQAYVNLRQRQTDIARADQTNAMNLQLVSLMEQRYSSGTASRIDVERLRTQYESSSAQATSLKSDMEAAANALAILTGQVPGTIDGWVDQVEDAPLPPAKVAVGDPETLLKRRPDIRAAERKLAASNARIGVAEAAKFPSLSFLGLLGLGGTEPGDLFKLDDFTAIAAPQLKWSVLDFGRNNARVLQSEAGRDLAEAQYRQTVLNALREVEDALSSYTYARKAVAGLARARASAAENVDLTEQRYRGGIVSLADVIMARRQLIASEESLSRAKASLTSDFITLQKALGLGWSDAEAGNSIQ
ncbi:efflux transporter outer membrane subunit [Altericroceibacterium endophyticum]|uniref:Efflux transporter outer membrane subunit n=1 Tax=Altericroceibacterium endophyticum TaxID=1808508 RepID=A0A6I4TAN3_9SPHN|nr:efflux transporter outer membrane subunit [Altericroceibacterium endophyticum]MXO66815.1 efflux transporter outer membrane subunit [Altericroceibacterium endophyticum]